MAQLPPPAKEAPQVLLAILKSPWFVPTIAILLKFIAELARFVIVTVCAALVVPTVTVPKFKLVGDTFGGQGVPTAASASQVACAAVLAESVCDCEM
jgi:hypothetical protein